MVKNLHCDHHDNSSIFRATRKIHTANCETSMNLQGEEERCVSS
ncbi:hypothetical protein FOYG_06519 [Fusarium oxysporum NRRL 32931]|uniref:Uncharacterized protein n=1 Tax=Fusarium oxysporum NRRL 32931 TaxID=660029 RepID=W9IK71_FUSOX|nr:hypothetical protein FOYG_06519 [Fusarium oxysporum NRRL 32931]